MNVSCARRVAVALCLTMLVPLAVAGAGRASGAFAAGESVGSYLVMFAGPTRWDAWQDVLGSRADADAVASGEIASGESRGRDAVLARARSASDAAAARIARVSSPVAEAVTAAGGGVVARYDAAVAGLLVHLPATKAQEIAGLPGVERLERVPWVTVALKDSVPGVGADRVHTELGVRGSGATIGVVDTGIDYTHAAFGGPGTEEAYAFAAQGADRVDDTWQGAALFPTTRIVGGHDFAGARYTPDCTSAGERLGTCSAHAQPDADPLDTHGHGTHVAGIAAGAAVGAVGDGVAPGASLVALKIFGSTGRTDLIVDPFEWAIEANMGLYDRPRIDVLNLSLGQRYGAELSAEEDAVRRAVEAGMVVVASVGNDSYLPFIASAPGIAADALAIASHTPPGRVTWTASLQPTMGEPIEFGATSLMVQAWSPAPRTEIAAPVVYVGRGCPGSGTGDPADPYLADPAGRIAMFDLAWSGGGASCTADRQAGRLQQSGAVGVLIAMGIGIQQAPRWDGVPIVDVPVWTVDQTLESTIREASAPEAPARLVLRPVPVPDATGVVSEFSSRGPARTGRLKPDLSAPGAGIFSAAIGQGRRGIGFSGTSMAAPHASGAAALVWSSARAGGREPTAREVAARLVTTADPAGVVISAERRETPSMARTGAGALDAWAAVGATTVVRAGEIARLDFGLVALDAPVVRDATVKVTNLGANVRRYRAAPRFRTDSDRDHGLDLVPAKDELTVAPGATERMTVSARLEPDRLHDWRLRGGAAVGDVDALATSELDGWLEVTDTTDPESEVVYRVPFYVLARRAADVRAEWADAGTGDLDVRLSNASPYPGSVELFELAVTDPSDVSIPAKIDLDAVGVRATPDDQGNTVVEFALHTRAPRVHPLETVSWVELDTDLDGASDFVVYTEDEECLRTDGVRYNGRVTTALEPAGGAPFGSPTTRFYADVDLNAAFTVLSIVIEDTGLTPSTLRFQFRVRQRDFVERDVVESPQYDQVPVADRWLLFDARDRDRVPRVGRADVGAGETVTVSLALPAPASGVLALFPTNAPGPGDAAVWPEPPAPPPASLALPWVGVRAGR